MDAYEATRIVFNRIQSLDPENAAKIMGLLLIQDHGEKEMIRLAFGPETLLLSIIVKAKKELNLQLPSSPSSAPISPSPFHHHHHHHNHLTRQSSSWAPPPPLTIASPSWAPQPDDLSVDDFQGGGGQQDGGQIPFFDGGAHQHRSCSAASDFCLSPEGAAGFGGWKPCLYFARGFCKNGSSCRFLHGLPDDGGASLIEQQCQDLLLRSKNQRLGVSAAGAFPYSPTGAVPVSPSSSKCYFLQNEGQRAVVAAAAAAMMLGDESHKFMGRSRSDFAGMVNPGSRQIYLTFPADSTFREEDVSNYFSIYGPVQDVRIPYQQKRMFGFVTFVYPETVKLILAKGNPHFVCDARVLVKPYKEKGKVIERKQHGERGEFSNCTTPTGLDSRDPYDLNQLGARMMYNSSQEMMLRRKLEEQQQAAELQQAIELQGRRFMGLQLLDFKNRSLLSSKTMSSPTTIVHSNDFTHEGSPTEEKSPSPVSSSELQLQLQVKAVNTVGADKEECCPNEDSDFQESVEHNLPDSPFASPIKAATFAEDPFVLNNPHAHGSGNQLIGSNLLPPTSTLDLASFNSCYFQMPRFSPGHGAVGL